MFERFTKEARGVVIQAYAEAAAARLDRIGTAHLLVAAAADGHGEAGRLLARLGLDAETLRADLRATAGPGDLDAAALASIGIDLDEVRRRAEEAFGPGALNSGRRGRPLFTREAKRALELALREALALDDNRIGSEHVLLGVLRDPGEAVATVLHRHGHTPKGVREAVLAGRRTAG